MLTELLLLLNFFIAIDIPHFRVHFCLTYNHASKGVIDAFLGDLCLVVNEVSRRMDKGNNSHTVCHFPNKNVRK